MFHKEFYYSLKHFNLYYIPEVHIKLIEKVKKSMGVSYYVETFL